MPKIFNIVQFEVHPITGETLITEEGIKNLVSHKSVKSYAYIFHDADIYSAEDETDDLKRVKTEYEKLPQNERPNFDAYVKEHHYKRAGCKKHNHWHIVISCNRNMDIKKIAEWLKIPEQYIEVPDGRNRFMDCVRYLTHEKEPNKHRYSDDCVVANFDWRKILNEIDAKREKYGEMSEKDYYRNKVCYEGMTISEVIKENPQAFLNDMNYLIKCRTKYLSDIAPMPAFRINLYVDGKGGVGKNTMCKALARMLYPDKEDEDLFFEVGGNNTSFEGYDGQPIVIWNDFRSGDLIGRFGRGEVFDIFDSHPTGAKHNIKYGSVKLTNTINIVNGIEDYKSFLDGLAGEYKDRYGNENKAEDKGQSYRRFPIIVCLRESDYDVLLNKGVSEKNSNYFKYKRCKNINGSFAAVAHKLGGDARKSIEAAMVKPIVDAIMTVRSIETEKITSNNEIPEEFRKYGSGYNMTDD